MKPDLVMLGGWAHRAKALQPLAEALRDFAEPRLVAAHEPLPAPERPAFLLGWSLGGLLALRAARAASQHWLGLILVGTCARFCAAPDYPQGVAPARVRALKAALRKQPADALSRFFADVAAPQAVPSDVLAACVRDALAIGTDALAAGLESLLTLDLRAELEPDGQPALVLHGREDQVIPWPAGAWLAEHLRFSRFVLLEGVGHDLPCSAPGPAAQEIRAFIDTF